MLVITIAIASLLGYERYVVLAMISAMAVAMAAITIGLLGPYIVERARFYWSFFTGRKQ